MSVDTARITPAVLEDVPDGVRAVVNGEPHEHQCPNCGQWLECEGNCDEFIKHIDSECRALER